MESYVVLDFEQYTPTWTVKSPRGVKHRYTRATTDPA